MRNLDEVEREALIAYCKEQLKDIGLTDAEIEDLEEKGEIVRFYGQLIGERI